MTMVAGCAGQDPVEPPAELQPIEQTLEIRELWSTRVGSGSERLRLGLKPATDGARIYAAARDGQVAAYDAQTGRRVWAVDTRLPLSGGPAYDAGALAVGSSKGDLLLLDAQTGAERWRIPIAGEVLASPAVAQGLVIVRTTDGRLRAFAVEDGRVRWTVEQSVPVLILRGNTAPVIAGTAVVAGFDNGRLGAYDLQTGDVLWDLVLAAPSGTSELDRLVDLSAGLHVIGRDVYASGYHGRAVAIDLDAGLVLWQHEISSYAGLGADLNNVYVTDEFGAVVALDRRRGTPVWRQEALRLRDVTAPTRYANTVVVGDLEGYVHWLDPVDGRFLARERAASARIAAEPLVVGQNVYVQTDDGTVAAFTLVEETESDR
jgi:outer membrane protein assembly factor BamB